MTVRLFVCAVLGASWFSHVAVNGHSTSHWRNEEEDSDWRRVKQRWPRGNWCRSELDRHGEWHRQFAVSRPFVAILPSRATVCRPLERAHDPFRRCLCKLSGHLTSRSDHLLVCYRLSPLCAQWAHWPPIYRNCITLSEVVFLVRPTVGEAPESTWPRKKETRPDLYTELVLSLLFAQNGSPVCFALPLYSLVRVAPAVRE